ncbi:hypothetical protein TNCT_230301 [Trichonephila clavata]|uniref:Uncharacterized protein n=1 Tax=Trichonephila clavata TaxID=2740835 RepID=A0A8X6HIX9_TRICU|nr:hypothetical protein TNCT_230301 [Trichonephila clavata]
MGGVDGIWPPSGHEEVPGLHDGVEFSTRCHHIFGYMDSFQFHRGPRQTPNSHTCLTCQVEPPEDSSKLDGGETPITCCRAWSKDEAKEDFSV